MTLIDEAIGKVWQKRARLANSNKIDNLIEARKLFKENEDAYRAEKVVMQFYEEAADWMDSEPKTVQDDLGIIREYPSDKLRYWTKNGASFNHIDKANWVQNIEGSKYYGNASGLLDAVIELGDEKGKRMTVKKMVAFALSELSQKDKNFHFVSFVQSLFSKLMLEIPQSWSADKRKAFEAFLADTRQRMEDNFFNE